LANFRGGCISLSAKWLRTSGTCICICMWCGGVGRRRAAVASQAAQGGY
jgi:hypothetical protein